MPRNPTKLYDRYGRLTVLSEDRVHGQRVVNVRCDCGKEKTVPAYALIAGNVRSCGARGCRGVMPDREVITKSARDMPKLRALRGFDANVVRAIWDAHEQLGSGGKELAEMFVKNASTVYTLLRHIRDSGGVDNYLKRTGQLK